MASKMQLNMILKLQDGVSRGLKKIERQIDKINKKVDKLNKKKIKIGGRAGARGGSGGSGGGGSGGAEGGGLGGVLTGAGIATFASSSAKATAQIQALATQLDFVKSRMDAIKAAGGIKIAGVDKTQDVLMDLADESVRVKQKMRELESGGTSTFGRLRSSITKTSKAFLAIGAAVAATIGSAINVTRNFEQLRARLETVTGSAEKAKSAFALIKDTASQLPTTVEQTTEAFIRMESLGITPTQERMIAFGNVAAAMGKDVMQFTEAVADAAVGEFERLKEFGIKARSEGDKVSFTFQGQTKTIKKNSAEIVKYLEDIGRVEFAGAAAKQMDTINGKASNLGDTFNNLLDQIGTTFAPLVKTILRGLTSIVEWFGKGYKEVRRFGMALVGQIARGWMAVRHSFDLAVLWMDVKWQQFTNSMERAWIRSINKIKSGWNDVAGFFGADSMMADIDRVPPKVRNLEQAIEDLKKTQAAEIQTHKEAMDLWNKDIPLTEEGAKVAAEYNEELKALDATRQSDANSTDKQSEAQKKLNQLMEEGKQTTEDLRTDIEIYEDEIERLGGLLKAGAIDIDTFNRGVKAAKEVAAGGTLGDILTDEETVDRELNRLDRLRDAGILTQEEYARAYFNTMEQLEDDTEETVNQVTEFWKQGARNIQDSFANTFFDWMQGRTSDMVGDFKRMIDRMVADLLASQLSSFLLGNMAETGKIGGFIGKGLTSLFGARAMGGPVSAGTPYIVGERGPELFTPTTSGHVTPNHELGGTNVNINISAMDGADVRRTLEKERRWIAEMVGGAGKTYNLRTA